MNMFENDEITLKKIAVKIVDDIIEFCYEKKFFRNADSTMMYRLLTQRFNRLNQWERTFVIDYATRYLDQMNNEADGRIERQEILAEALEMLQNFIYGEWGDKARSMFVKLSQEPSSSSSSAKT